MLVTWRETQNWCGQLVSARNSLQLVLAIRGATQGRSQNPLQENLRLSSETQMGETSRGCSWKIHGNESSKKVELMLSWLKMGNKPSGSGPFGKKVQHSKWKKALVKMAIEKERVTQDAILSSLLFTYETTDIFTRTLGVQFPNSHEPFLNKQLEDKLQPTTTNDKKCRKRKMRPQYCSQHSFLQLTERLRNT